MYCTVNGAVHDAQFKYIYLISVIIDLKAKEFQYFILVTLSLAISCSMEFLTTPVQASNYQK